MSRHATLAAALLMALGCGGVAAQIHKWKDERGVTHYSAEPPPGRPGEVLRGEPLPPPVPPPGSPATPYRQKSYQEMADEARRERHFREQRLREERDERLRPQREAQARKARCAKSRGNVRTLESQREVIYSQKGKSGYLGGGAADEAKRRELLDEARAGVERNCVD